MKRISNKMKRAAFTLMEVNLAIFIMAVGVLAMISLYPLGFRESQQSRDDVRAAAMADLVLGQITAALSSRYITWSEWKNAVEGAVNVTQEGWFSYLEKRGSSYRPVSNPSSTAQNVVSKLMKANPRFSSFTAPNGVGDDYHYAVVAAWGKRPDPRNPNARVRDFSRVSVSFRGTRRPGALFAQPMYYTEIHFQGDQKDMVE